MNRRRKIRRRPSAYRGRKIQVNFAPVIVIICLSVCAGYLTAKYVVYPILGSEPAGLHIFQGNESSEKKSEEKAETEKSKSVKESTASSADTTAASEAQTAAAQTTAAQTTAAAGVIEDQVELAQAPQYAIQFGSYSTKAAADKSVAQLKQSGVKAEIVEKDGAYKVISKLFETKDKAKAALSKMDASLGAFVTTVE